MRTVHETLGDFERFAELSEHALHQFVSFLVRIGTQRVTADSLENTARGVRQETHDSARFRMDLLEETFFESTLSRIWAILIPQAIEINSFLRS